LLFNIFLTIILPSIIFLFLNHFLSLSEAVLKVLEKEQFLEKEYLANKKDKVLKDMLNKLDFHIVGLHFSVLLLWLFFGKALAMMVESILLLVVIILVASLLAIIQRSFVRKAPIKNPELKAMRMIVLLRPIMIIFKPFVIIIEHTIDALLKKRDINIEDMGVTKDDIRYIVKQGSEKGSLDLSEQKMIDNIFELREKQAEDVAVHRMDIVAIDLESNIKDIIDVFLKTEYSRFPIYNESIDNIVGILHIKDLMRHILAASERKESIDSISIKNIMRKPYFVIQTKTVDIILNEMQKEKCYMAIVLDEYGGCLGLLTAEDLLEEIVGSIYDEHDEADEPEIVEFSDEKYIILGQTELTKISEYLKIELPHNEYDTLGGFLVHLLDHIPYEGETPTAQYAGYTFRVNQVKENRIISVIVTKNKQ